MNSPTASLDLIRFDVRDIPCRVKHAQIFRRWADLPVGQYFILINDHDPVPLWYQFVVQFTDAFDWEYLQRGPEEYHVKITKLRATTASSRPSRATSPAEPNRSGLQGDALVVDARGLEPPEPLMRVLNALESLREGQVLRAITDRQPCHLFGEAESRGFQHACAEQPDGSWITLLRRA